MPFATAWFLLAQAAVAPPNLDQILARAAAYVELFNTTFTKVVAEERYVQWASGEQTLSRSGRNSVATISGMDRRELASDFLLVKLPGADSWVSFRDTFEVDGKPVRQRQDRLSRLMLHPTDDAVEQARRLLEESTRYNIGNVSRTVNMPLVA